MSENHDNSGERQASACRCTPRSRTPSPRWLLAPLVLLILGSAFTVARRSNDEAAAALPEAKAPPKLSLSVTDARTGRPTAARFSLSVDGKPYYPDSLGEHGLRFVSIHEAKQQTYVVTYARGTGPVEVSLPAGAKQIEVHAAKGFEYHTASAARNVNGRAVSVDLKLLRWVDPLAEGWAAADEHVHYDRLRKTDDADWLTMLDGDGLTHAHFMVLKGGKVPGVWARQYAYGKPGEADDGTRLIRSGEEYRDSAQGHINLLGPTEVIPPISTGGLGTPPVPYNYPPLRDVFLQNRRLGGIGGVAHGGSLGRFPTAPADALTGVVDFFEIANAHLYSLDLWYRLMNCGYVLPPAAGTDLPNYPFRDPWQPFLGSMRMYVRVGNRRDFESWKQALKRGEVYVTSGPLLSFRVNGEGPGKTVRLPAPGGRLRIEAELASPRPLRSLEIIKNGKPIPADIRKQTVDPTHSVHRWKVNQTIHVTDTCWLALRGRGETIDALKNSLASTDASWLETDVIAHSAAVKVQVGDQPLRSPEDAEYLLGELRRRQEFYRTRARYKEADHRLRMLELFDQAAEQLAGQL